MQISRSSIETTPGPAEWFTGAVYIDTVATPAEPARLQASSVHFTPGARTAWHTHPKGQTITSPRASACASVATDRSK
jgi:quercetin dioxygenase-like cupin family protein